MRKSYAEKKEEVRNEAHEWLDWMQENPVSWEGLFIAQDYFEKQGKRYGLLTEFRENAIC